MNRTLHLPRASYDADATAIRLSYDADPARNLMDDPTVAHELVHYGQNLGTGLGVEQTFFASELYIATCDLLADPELQFRLPLTDTVGAATRTDAWYRAQVARRFISNMLGQADFGALGDWSDRHRRMPLVLLDMSRKAGPDDWAVDRDEAAHPVLNMRGDESAWPVAVDGSFVMEVHARVAEFLSRWTHAALSIDDAVNYFRDTGTTPYFAPVSAVHSALARRFDAWDVQDAMFICHLAAHLALNGTGLLGPASAVPVQTTDSGPYTVSYVHPGRLFIRILSACADTFRRPGEAAERYFKLMETVLSNQGLPEFTEIMTTILDKQIAPMHAHALSQEGWFPFLATKMAAAKATVNWLLDAAARDDTMGFVRASAELVQQELVPGPLIVGPNSYSMITIPGRTSEPDLTMPVDHYIRATITHKLWHDSELTCAEPNGSPLSASTVACESVACQQPTSSATPTGGCRAEIWFTALRRYPGLSGHLGL